MAQARIEAGTWREGAADARLAPKRRRRRRLGSLIVCVAIGALGVVGATAASTGAGVMIYVANVGSSTVTPVVAGTDTALRSISMSGLVPVSLALTPDGRRLYVVGVGSDEDGSPGSVLAIDTATDTLSNPITVGAAPQQIVVTPNGKTAYVLGGIDAATTPSTRAVTVTPIDTATELARAPIPVGTLPKAMVLSPNGGELYVLDTSPADPSKPTGITPVDTATGKAAAPIKVPALRLVFAPNSKTAYAIDSPPSLVPIDVETGLPRKAIALGNALALDAAVTPDGKTVEVLGTPDPGLEAGSPQGDNWTLTPVAAATSKAGAPITLGAHPGAQAGTVTIAPNGLTAEVLIEGTAPTESVVVPVDLATSTAGAPIRVGANATELAFAPDGASTYVLDSGATSAQHSAGSLVPISTASERAGSPIAVGAEPIALAIGSVPTIPAPSAKPLAAVMNSSGVRNLVATTQVKAQLTAAFAAARKLPLREVAGTYAGSVYYAYDIATHTYWAAASFDPARGDPVGVLNSFQDAGSNGLFARAANGMWRFRGSGAPLACAEEQELPVAIARLWGVPAHVAGC